MIGIIRTFVNFLQGIPKYIRFIYLRATVKKDESRIPDGGYCYKVERLEGVVVYTKVCPYYYYGHRYKCGCLYTGFYGYDIILGDQVKVCEVNNER